MENTMNSPDIQRYLLIKIFDEEILINSAERL